MKKSLLSRLGLVSGVASLAAAVMLIAAPAAAAYPDKPIKLVIPYPPGGIADLIGRRLAHHLQQSMGQPVIVDNKGGAGGIIGTDAVAKSPPDGYTIFLAAIGQAVVNNHLYKKLPYDPNTALVPISLIAEGPNVLVVNASSPVKSVADLLVEAKKEPGKLVYGSFGNGSSPHLSAALLSQQTEAAFVHVPYKGSAPAMTDLLGGQTAFMFDSLITSMPHIKSGKLRALAVTTSKRNPALPNVPTMIEGGVPNFNVLAWFGIHAPGKTPPEIINHLNKEINAFARLPEMRKQFAEQGLDLVATTPGEYAQFIESESKKWGAVVRSANITLD